MQTRRVLTLHPPLEGEAARHVLSALDTLLREHGAEAVWLSYEHAPDVTVMARGNGIFFGTRRAVVPDD